MFKRVELLYSIERTVLLITLIVLATGNLYAQETTFGAVGQTPKKKIISVPEFLDSLKFKADLKKIVALKDIYLELKKDSVGAVYQYSFYVEKDGKIILLNPERKSYLLRINSYVESVFKDYKWKPAHKLSCEKCKVKTLGILCFYFDTEHLQIVCYIKVNTERGNRVFYEEISMK